MALPAYTGATFVGVENLHNDIYPAIDASKNKDLQQPGKVVLITGAGRGIGRAIAIQYAHAGVASLVIAARTSKQLDEVESVIKQTNSNVRVHKLPLDVTSESAVAEAAKFVTEKEGRLDVLINNAGGSELWAPIAESKPAEYWKTWEVNMKGPYLLTQAFLPLLQETAKKNGKVVDLVNVSSIGAHTVMSGASAYQVSKLALLRFSEFVDFEYGKQGVNVISLHPGGVMTELSKEMEEIQPFLNDTPELAGGFVPWLTKGGRTWLAARYVSATWDVEKLESMKDEIVKGDKLKMRMVV